ncbi:MAG: saccharopine dehydrogenase family protein [Methanotrichaceae archaeon]
MKNLKIIIFGGAGKIGSAVAWDLAKDDRIESIGIAGRNQESLERISRWIKSDKILPCVLDINDALAVRKLMGQYDVGVIALPDRRASYRTVEAAIDSGLNVVDVLEEYHRRPEPYETEGLEIPQGMSLDDYGELLHNRAIDNSVTLLDGMGFAPGLSNIALREGIRKVNADSAVARVGGIPSKKSAKRHPLKYMVTWSFSHVLREYMVKVRVIQDGRVREVDATSGRECFRFDEFGKDEELECAITPGMPSFLYTRRDLKSFSEKTIRWPGHWQAIDTLKECGLLDLIPIEMNGRLIRPRDFFLSLIEPKLRPLPGDEDVCVMWNTASGKDGRADYYMWTEADTGNGISAMAKVTGFSAAIGARMLGSGGIETNGIVPPEDAISGELYQSFMEELAKRDITVVESVVEKQ